MIELNQTQLDFLIQLRDNYDPGSPLCVYCRNSLNINLRYTSDPINGLSFSSISDCNYNVCATFIGDYVSHHHTLLAIMGG